MQVDNSNGITTVVLDAQFSSQNAMELNRIVGSVLSEGATVCILDCGALTDITSTGIGHFVTLLHSAKEEGRSIVFRNLSETIRTLFADSGLDTIFDIDTGSGVQQAVVDLFKMAVDVRLNITEVKQPDLYVMRLSGIMNHPAGSRFFKQQFLLAMAFHTRILIDLEELTFFDSISVGVLLSLNRLLTQTGGSMRLCGANYLVSDLFVTLGIDKIISLYDTQSSALVGWS